MDSAGDKKRIRALFRELSLEHQSVVPRFEEIWRRAETTAPDSLRSSMSPSLTLLVSVLALAAVGSFALWSRYPSAQTAQVVVSPTHTLPRAIEQEKVVSTTQIKSSQQFRKRVARQRKMQRPVQELAMLSNWHSPTVSFLQFPVSPVFNSLPQLDQSARELESFLPDKDVKEFKQ
jgi:hypothetical protein